MAGQHKSANRSATDRLAKLVADELKRQGLNGEQAAREAKLPADAFRGLLLRRQRPSFDRADELCRALGVTITIGSTRPVNESNDVTGRRVENDNDHKRSI